MYPPNTLPGTYWLDRNSTTTYMYDVSLEPTLTHMKTTTTHFRNEWSVESTSDPPETIKANIGFSTLPLVIGSRDATRQNYKFHLMLSPESMILGHARECPPHSRLEIGITKRFAILLTISFMMMTTHLTHPTNTSTPPTHKMSLWSR